MKGSILILLLWAFLAAVAVASKESKTTNGTRMVKVTKVFRKKARQIKKTEKKEEESKSESLHIPVLVAPGEHLSHDIVPIHIKFADEYLQSADDRHSHDPHHYIQPVDAHHQQSQGYGNSDQHSAPVYVDSNFHHKPTYGDSDHALHAPYGDSDHSHQTSYGGSDHSPNTNYGNSIHHSPSPYVHDEYIPENYGDLSAIPGIPSIDYPTYAKPPHTSFHCQEHTGHPGFYADVETRCQMWHYCQPDGRHDRFLCPNGTVFDQLTRVCNWWFNVHCDQSLSFYDINFDLYKVPVNKAPAQLQNLGFHHEIAQNQAHGNKIHPSSFLYNDQNNPSDYDSSSRHSGPDYDNERQRIDRNFQDDGPFQNRHVQSAANPPVHRYPLQIAPQPKIVIDADNIPVAIPIDDSHPSANSQDYSFHDNRHYEDQDTDHIDQASSPVRYSKRNFAHPVAYKITNPNEDEIPTYRERKAFPGSGRKLRVVKRRKLHKHH